MKPSLRRRRALSLVTMLSIMSLLLSVQTVSAKEMADMGAPSAPINLVVAGSLSNQLTLNWDFGTYDTEAGLGFPDQFVVYRTEGANTNFSTAMPLIVMTANNKSYTDMTVKPNTMYHYKVAARLGDKESANSNLADITTQQAPFSVEATALGASKVSLTWNNVVAGTQKYNVYRSTVSGNYELVGSTTALTYTDSGLTGNTYYAYNIKPVTAMGEDYGGLAYVTTLAADRVAAPTMAPVLKGNPVIPTINNLEWNEVSGATTYALYRATSGMPPVLVASTSKLGYPDMTVKSGYEYVYTVKAVNEFGESAPSNEITIKTATPRAPSVSVKTTGRNQITVSWMGVTDAQTYNIYRSTDGRGFTLVSSTAGSATMFVDKDLAYDTTYFYYVKAKTGPADASIGDEGEKSETVSAKTLGQYSNLPAPVLTGRALSKTSAEITWNEVPGAVKYIIYRDYSDQNVEGVGKFPGSGIIVTGTKFVDTQAFPIVRYTYTVAAMEESGTSGLSGQVVVEVGDYKDTSTVTEKGQIITATAYEIKAPSPITFKLPTLGGDTMVYSRQGKTVRFSYAYKNTTAKAQRVRLVRQLIRPGGTVAETTGLYASPGAYRSLVYSPAITFSGRAPKGLYKVVVKAYDTVGKNYGKLLGENSFTIQVQ